MVRWFLAQFGKMSTRLCNARLNFLACLGKEDKSRDAAQAPSVAADISEVPVER